MIVEIRCGRRDRAGRLSVWRLVAQHGPDASLPHVMAAEVCACPNRDSAQIQNRCGPYSPTLERLFRARDPVFYRNINAFLPTV